MASSTEQNTVTGSDVCEGSGNRIIPPEFEWLQTEAVGFSLCGDQIQVLSSPVEFYNAIIKGCKEANVRIVLATLYIAIETPEQQMMDVLADCLETRGRSLEVTVLLDAIRGGRDGSVHSMWLPLVRKHPNCQVSLYHTPELRGFWRKILPTPYNELFGIQHIKLFVFDDDIIISGSNLSMEGFERVGRYMVISNCPSMAEFCHGLIQKINSVCLQLMPDGTFVPRLPHLHPYTNPPGQYEKYAREVIWGYYQKSLKDADNTTKPGDDTWLFPLLQLPPIYITQDSWVTRMIMQSIRADSVVHFCSAYFNLVEEYIDTLLLKTKAKFYILIPHPTQNKQSKAGGLKALIPWVFNAIARTFLQQVDEAEQTERITVGEFLRSEGSYHCKGIWITNEGQDTPHITVTGSSNFSYRSVKRDLEFQVVLLTSNQTLRRSLEYERQRIYRHMVPLTLEVANQPDRRPRILHWVLLWIFKPFM